MRIDRWLCWNLGNTSNLTAQVTFMTETFNWAFYKEAICGVRASIIRDVF